MTTPNEAMNSINQILRYLVECGLADDQNFAFRRPLRGGGEEIAFAGSDAVSVALRNRAYVRTYEQLVDAGAFNAKMADGALVQMMYAFIGRRLTRHRLAFFPSAHLDEFQRAPEVYLYDEVLADVVGRTTVAFPFRFDYDTRGDHQPIVHPKCHLTLGQFPECRIPVSAPVTPARFMDFVLRNFYDTEAYRNADGLPVDGASFGESIHPEERRVVYVTVPP